MAQATREEDRPSEDEIALKKLGPQGVPGAPDTGKRGRWKSKCPGLPISMSILPDLHLPLLDSGHGESETPISARSCGDRYNSD
jgi:hypothetical protein